MKRKHLLIGLAAIFLLAILGRLKEQQPHGTEPIDPSVLPIAQAATKNPWDRLLERVDQASQKKLALDAIENGRGLDDAKRRDKKAELFQELVRHVFFDDIRQDLLRYRLEFFDSSEAKQVPQQMMRLPSGLDFQDRFEKRNPFGKYAASDVLAVFGLKAKTAFGPKLNPAFLAVAFSPDGRWLVGAGEDPNIKLWDTTHARMLQHFPSSLKGHLDRVVHLEFSPDGQSFASASFDGTARLWDTKTHNLLYTFDHSKKRVHNVSFHPEGTQLATSCDDGSIRLWDLATGKEIRQFDAKAGKLAWVAFTPDGKNLFWIGETPEIHWTEALQGEASRTHFTPIESPASCMGFSPDGKTLAIGLAKDSLTWFHWDGFNLRQTGISKEHRGHLHQLAFGPDGRQLAAVGDDPNLRVWSVETTKPQRSLGMALPFATTMYGLAIAPDGRHVATANSNGLLTILRLGH